MSRASCWLSLVLLLAGCAPRIRVAWYHSPTGFPVPSDSSPPAPGGVYLALVNEHHAAVTIDRLMVNDLEYPLPSPLVLPRGRFKLFPMSVLLGDCGVPYRVAIHPKDAWRWARVRGLSTMPDAIPSTFADKPCVVAP